MLGKRTGGGLRVANLLALLTLAATAGSQVTYTKSFPQTPPVVNVVEFDGSLQSVGGSPTFNRPVDNGNLPPTGLSGIGTAVFYDAHPVTVTQDANYDFTTTASFSDYLLIYQDSFDPGSPLTNCLVARYGSGGAAAISAFHLAPGNYVLVSCAYDNGVAGSISVTGSQPATPGSALYTASDTTAPASGSPTFNRPLANGNSAPTSLSGVGTAVFYDDHTFTVPTSGTYSIVSTCVAPANWDNYTFLYKDTFSPATPLVNCLIGNDSLSGTTTSGFTIALTAGTTYHLITSSYANATSGTFTNTVSPVAIPTYDSWSGTTVGGPLFKRPSSLTAQASGASYEYDAHTWTATVSGSVTFKSVYGN